MLLRRIVTFLLVFSLFRLPVFSAEAAQPETVSLEEAIIEACMYQQKVDLTDYSIPRSEFGVLFDELYYKGKLPWYTSGSYSLTYDQHTNHMVTFTPELIGENLDMAGYERRVAEILHDCLLPGMTPVQIALVLHDYLAVNIAYDHSLEHNSGYDAIMNGTSACAGYAEAYRDLMNRAGIETIYVSSEEMDHAWNLVCIDGNWYHVDVTWDDPTPHMEGRLRHFYFLRTDEEMRNSEDAYSGWETDITCTDTRFSDGWWLDVKSQICYKDLNTCYVLRSEDLVNSIYLRNEDTGLEKRIYQEKRSSIDIGQGNYKYSHFGLSYRGGMLYFNTLNAVMRMDPETGGTWVQHAHSGNTFICSSNVTGDTLSITYMTHDSEATHEVQTLEPLDKHQHSYTQTQVSPTCAQAGYTESVCSCGLSFQSTPVQPLPHDYSYMPNWDLTVTKTCADCAHVSAAPLIPKKYQLSAILLGIGAIFLIWGLIPSRKRKG